MKQSNGWLKCFHLTNCCVFETHTAHSREEFPSTFHVHRQNQSKKKTKKNIYIYILKGKANHPKTKKTSTYFKHFGAEKVPLVSLYRVKENII